jgi:hypothetical protein
LTKANFSGRNLPLRAMKQLFLRLVVIPQLWVQVIQMHPYTPLWKRGARGDFTSIILKSPFIPLYQRGIKTPETEGLHL